MEKLNPHSFDSFTVGRTAKIRLIVILTLLFGLAAVLLPPISQPLDYHHFADIHAFFGIPNFLNVISNLSFILTGLAGFRVLSRIGEQNFQKEKIFWRIFFSGSIATGIGSAYYHFAPDNSHLIWDRLPMTMVMMSFLAAIFSDRIGTRIGRRMLAPAVLLGIGSVLYWGMSDDLRPYIFVQFFPLLLIPVLIGIFPSRFLATKYLVSLMGFYVLAKLTEHFDGQIFGVLKFVSGHTLKHLIAAVGIFQMVAMLKNIRLGGRVRG